MKKILIFLLIAGYGFAADFLVLFDMPDNKKYVKHKNIPFYKEVKKELPPLKTLVPIPGSDNYTNWELYGIVQADNRRIAIINGNLYKMGDLLGVYKITEIAMNYVEIEHKGKKTKIFMK
ncbi:hypothetical protein [Calditerrivibrio nitroreducens]|uniref:Uncharacterized protein n=1 Tax=Calditerrivibrio nitroreducens (strain DSM 19672 / NBRC 101217 / Yu37-1) TaxID=768670 RepID=E4TEI9_CALNY|nr:hypothetical protein [Calditerrivibrio nitroreducens]ADR18315.1 hypothetical protein Calni_0402 [Calditerrivibrio nitroreducens DSM 19672]